MIEKSRIHLQRQVSRSSICSNSSSEGEVTPRTSRSKKGELLVERRSLDRIPSARDEEAKLEQAEVLKLSSSFEIQSKVSIDELAVNKVHDDNISQSPVVLPNAMEIQVTVSTEKTGPNVSTKIDKAYEEKITEEIKHDEAIKADPAVKVVTKPEDGAKITKLKEDKKEVDAKRKISQSRPMTVQQKASSKTVPCNNKKTTVKVPAKAVSKKLEPIANKAVLQPKTPKKSVTEDPREQKKTKPLLKKEVTHVEDDKNSNKNFQENSPKAEDQKPAELKRPMPFEQYTSPVISDPFETIKQVQQKAAQFKAQVEREKSKVLIKHTNKKGPCPPSAVSKAKSKICKPSSGKRRVPKEIPDAIQITRPKSGKKGKKGRVKSAAKKNKALVDPNSEGVGFISGQGWHIQAGQAQAELAPSAIAKTVEQFSADDESPRKGHEFYNEIEFKWHEDEDNDSERLSECGLKLKLSDDESDNEMISAEIAEKEVIFSVTKEQNETTAEEFEERLKSLPQKSIKSEESLSPQTSSQDKTKSEKKDDLNQTIEEILKSVHPSYNSAINASKRNTLKLSSQDSPEEMPAQAQKIIKSPRYIMETDEALQNKSEEVLILHSLFF